MLRVIRFAEKGHSRIYRIIKYHVSPEMGFPRMSPVAKYQ